MAVAIETSTRAGSAAVRRGDARASGELDGEHAHASDLLPTLATLLARVGARPGEIEAVVVGTGPGSYTGLRVGIATALGLVRGTGALLRGVPSFAALALGALEPGERGSVLIDARVGELYLATYARGAGETLEVLRAPCVTTADELPRLLPDEGLLLCDEAAFAAARLDDAQRARVRADRVPRAADVLTLGLAELARRGSQRPEDVQPLYLRAFAAKTRQR